MTARGRVTIRAVLWLADRYRDGLAFVFGVVGPGAAYAFSTVLAHVLYRLLPPLRAQSEFQLRAAARACGRQVNVVGVARRAFTQRILDVTDVLLAERWLRPERLAALGNPFSEEDLAALRSAQHHRRPTVLVTGYYGPFDLLPLLLGYSGVQAAILYRPHANPGFDRLRRRIRAMAGCELVTVDDALGRLPRVLEAGGMVGVVADHHSERRGIETTFLGLPTRVPRTVGVLAARHGADVVTAGIRRLRGYRFRIEVTDIFWEADWREASDPVEAITQRYLRGIERLVWQDPTQYHWARARWGAALLAPLATPIVRAEPRAARL